MSAQGPEYSPKLQEKFFELEDAMKTILLCATLLILGMQAGVPKPALKSIGLRTCF